ncbi:S-protein secretion component K [Vibrio rotiferianus]|uniref:S-protein secretion component K n=1 Tax=Vibrio rotiferianus TaxID=190895 RepID=UPI00406A77C0
MMLDTKHQKGVVLPLTLIILAILTIMVSVLLGKSNQSVEQVRQVRDKWEAKKAIHSAEQRVQFAMMVGLQHPGAFQLGDIQLRTDGMPTKLSNGVWVSIQDQSGLLSLRFLRRDLMQLLMRSYVNEPRASNIVNDIIRYQSDTNSEVKIGAIPPREALFRSLDEVMLIPGITSDWYNGRRNLNLEQSSTVPSYNSDLREYGLRDLFTLSGSENMNMAAVPNELLKRVFGLHQRDIDRLERLKTRGDWNGVVSSLTALGLNAQTQSVPSSYYIIRYQYGNVQARGDYQVRTMTLPPRKREWFFPDNYRYFDISKN